MYKNKSLAIFIRKLTKNTLHCQIDGVGWRTKYRDVSVFQTINKVTPGVTTFSQDTPINGIIYTFVNSNGKY